MIFPERQDILLTGFPKSIAAVDGAMSSHKLLVFTAQKNAQKEPSQENLYDVGTRAQIKEHIKKEEDRRVIIRGLHKVKIQGEKR